MVGTYIKSIENNSLPLGINITASYYKYFENGFKIAGIDGEPINEEWRNFYNNLVNCVSLSEFIINHIIDLYQKNKQIFDLRNVPSICISIDTRPSSKNFFILFKYENLY